jgi:hypothetical protein
LHNKEDKVYIVKKGENPTMETKERPEVPSIAPDKRRPRQRFKVLSGAGGFYVYDYRTYDVVRNGTGKFFTTHRCEDAWSFLATLPQTDLTIKYKGKEITIYED